MMRVCVIASKCNRLRTQGLWSWLLPRCMTSFYCCPPTVSLPVIALDIPVFFKFPSVSRDDLSIFCRCVAAIGNRDKLSHSKESGTTSCKQTTPCLAGQALAVAPTAVRDRQCVSCVLLFSYNPAPGPNTTCTLVSTCPIGTQELTPPTTSTDRV